MRASRSVHGILSSVSSGLLEEQGFVGLIFLANSGIGRVVNVRVHDRLHELLKNLLDGESRLPAFLCEHVHTENTFLADVGMVNWRGKLQLEGLERIVLRSREVHLIRAVGKGCTSRPLHGYPQCHVTIPLVTEAGTTFVVDLLHVDRQSL